MSEWHVSVAEIVNTWSRELLNLMMLNLNERYRRSKETSDGKRSSEDVQQTTPQELAIMAPNVFKYEKV